MEADEKSDYFTKEKYIIDYSLLFEEELKELQGDSKTERDIRMNIEGRFIKENFEANERYTSVKSFEEELA